ncbi:hypothetical protein EK21DRAFT_34209, partial [Setomelanomma holmii]
LLPQMPSLFSKTLPPCGFEVQVAYENVVHRLRISWLHHVASAQTTENVPLRSLCDDIKTHLEREQLRDPIDSLHMTKKRRPWRRENVFRYELSWAAYFVREADVLQRWSSMGEEERGKQELTHGLYPIPKESKIIIKNRNNREELMRLWKVWHEEKRR